MVPTKMIVSATQPTVSYEALRREHPYLRAIVTEDALSSNAPHIQDLKRLDFVSSWGASQGIINFCSTGLTKRPSRAKPPNSNTMMSRIRKKCTSFVLSIRCRSVVTFPRIHGTCCVGKPSLAVNLACMLAPVGIYHATMHDTIHTTRGANRLPS